MGIVSRMSMILKSKMNRFLDSAEDPRETLDYSYEQQLEMLQGVRRGVVEMVTAKRRIQQQADRVRSNIQRLDGQARQAMSSGREDLARLALQRKHEATLELEGLDEQLAGMEQEQQKLTDAEARLTAKVNAFRSKKEIIKAQYSAAEAQVRIGAAMSGVSEEMSDVAMAVERAENKTDQMRAKAGAIDELVAAGTLDDGLDGRDDIERELARMTVDSNVEAEFEALKASSGNGVAARAGVAGPEPEEVRS